MKGIKNCLIVEDRELDPALEKIIVELGMDYIIKKDFSSAKEYIESNIFHYFITDNFLPMDEGSMTEPLGIDLVKFVRTRHRNNLVPTAILSGDNSFANDPNSKSLLDSLRAVFVFKDMGFKRKSNLYERLFSSLSVEPLEEKFLLGLKESFPSDDAREINMISHELCFTLLSLEDSDINVQEINYQLRKLGNLISSTNEVSDPVLKNRIVNSIDKNIECCNLNKLGIFNLVGLVRLLMTSQS